MEGNSRSYIEEIGTKKRGNKDFFFFNEKQGKINAPLANMHDASFLKIELNIPLSR